MHGTFHLKISTPTACFDGELSVFALRVDGDVVCWHITPTTYPLSARARPRLRCRTGRSSAPPASAVCWP
ncbi:MAG: hypothetical protein ACLUI3_06780 [Christensenellales bacterium]